MASQPHDKQLRVQGSRSSLGCLTCKSRHVKCDMRQPQCQRCVRAGRICDYLNRPVAQPVRHFIIYSIPGSPPAFPALGGPAQRALHHYRTRIASTIALPFGSELWSTIAIQMSAKYDFVMSALIALSSIYELHFQPSATYSNLQSHGIRHDNKAIKEIVALGRDEHSIDAILVSCIIFYALESLRDSWTQALQHGLSGMKLIGEQRRTTRDNYDIPVEILDETFLALQNQVMEFGGRDEERIFRPTSNRGPYVLVVFASVNEALHHLNVIYNESAYLLDLYRTEQTVTEKALGVPTGPEQHVTFLQARMANWTVAMQNLQSRGDDDPNCQQFHAILILNMYHAVFQYALDSLVDDNTCDYSNILGHAETFLKSQPQGEGLRSRTYSISLGVVPVLFMVATNGDFRLQERSIKLLRAHRRREGPWDSEVTVQLAERVIATKKELTERAGKNTSVSVLEINFVDDTKCQLTYLVKVQESGVRGTLWPAVASNDAWTHVDLVNVGEGQRQR